MSKWLSVSLAFLLIFSAVPQAFAKADGQTTDKLTAVKMEKAKKGKKVKVSGTIESVHVEEGTIELASRSQKVELLVTDKTKIKIAYVKDATIEDLLPTDKARVEYTVDEDTNTAESISVVRQMAPLKGKISEIDQENKTFKAAGKWVEVTGNTKIHRDDETIEFDELAVGDKVVAIGSYQGQKFVARIINVRTEDGDDDNPGPGPGPGPGPTQPIVYEGAVEAMGSDFNYLKVDGKIVIVTEKTAITLSETNETVAYSTIKSGDQVKATGRVTENILFAETIVVTKAATEPTEPPTNP